MNVWAAMALALTVCGPHLAQAADLPSFLRAGEAFCTDEADFDTVAAHERSRPEPAMTCQTIDRPTRVAVLQGQGGLKSQVLVISGPSAYAVGWTNGTLPVASPPTPP